MKKFSFKEIAPCLFAIFVDILGFGLVAPLVVAFFTMPQYNLFQLATAWERYLCLGVTLALYPLLMFFGTAFIGDLSDIIGRKKTLSLSMAGMALSFLMMGFGIWQASLTWFLLGRGLSGLVSASQSVALAAVSDLSTPENKAVHLSYIALVQCIGFIVGPLIGGVLSAVRWDTPFWGAAGFALLALFWILWEFEETAVKSEGQIQISRIWTVFADAYKDRRILSLSIVFLLMEIGVALYLPIMLILFTTQWGYSSVELGLFNGFLGVGFALGLVLVLPRLVKRFTIEQGVFFSLIIVTLAQLFSSITHVAWILWALAFVYAIAVEIAFSGMFTAFSNAASADSQGWVMGIAVAVMAIAWAVAGGITMSVPVIGVYKSIFFGAILLGISAVWMRRYCRQYVKG